MSNAFINFLSGTVGGLLGPGANLRDQQHANRLYVQNNYARAPKVGFLYFVNFNLGQNVIRNGAWLDAGGDVDAGLLVKKVDMPKFSIATEVINQYNKKTVIQTGIKYNPVTIDFHDDNSDITNGLWANYYKYYYTDGRYGDYTNGSQAFNNRLGGTKYGTKDYPYGLNAGQADPFFTSIDIFVLHQHRFTQLTLINPLINEWSHDSIDQSDGIKILSNKMTVSYESVNYKSGKIEAKGPSGQFTQKYYDKTASPLSIAGRGNSTIFGAGGILSGIDSVSNAIEEGNYLKAAIQASTTIRNAKNVTVGSLITEGTSIANSAFAGIAQSGQKINNQTFTQPGINNFLQSSGEFATNAIQQSGQFGVVLPNSPNASNNFTYAVPRSVTGR
jgi:hypothetical protein